MTVAPADPGLELAVVDARVAERTAAPTLLFRVAATATEPIHTVILRTRVLIAARDRRYTAAEEHQLHEVFGPVESWPRTLGPLAWADVTTAVPGFREHTTFDVPVTCTYDLELASTKFLRAAAGSDIPLLFLFSGTAFTRGPAGIGVVHLSRELEARSRIPPDLWRELMDNAFPGARWLRLRPDVFDRVARYKAEHALPTWDATLEHLLDATPTTVAASPVAP